MLRCYAIFSHVYILNSENLMLFILKHMIQFALNFSYAAVRDAIYLRMCLYQLFGNQRELYRNALRVD